MVGTNISCPASEHRLGMHIRGVVSCLVWPRVLGSVVPAIHVEVGYIVPYHVAVLYLSNFW